MLSLCQLVGYLTHGLNTLYCSNEVYLNLQIASEAFTETTDANETEQFLWFVWSATVIWHVLCSRVENVFSCCPNDWSKAVEEEILSETLTVHLSWKREAVCEQVLVK